MKKGSILVGILIILMSLIMVGIGASTVVLSTTLKTQRAYQKMIATDIAEGGINKALREINQANSTYTGTNGTPDSSLSGGQFEIEMNSNCGINCKSIVSTAYVPSKENFKTKRTIRVKVKDSASQTGVAFAYGVQAGPLGITMSNNSKITGINNTPGNVYSQGTLQGGNNNSVITGDVIMSGSTGKIDGVQIGGKAKAHTINNSTIAGDAYYQVIDSYSSNRVGGTKYPNSPDPTVISLPISSQTIQEWENNALAGGTYNGDLNLTGTVELGPKKIDGNLTADSGTILILKGYVWVTGNINFANNMTIVLDPGYGNSGSVIIADNPTNKANYGSIINGNNVKVCGSISVTNCQNDILDPNNKSSIMFLSTSTKSSVSDPAIRASNNSNAVIYYTTTGLLEVANNASLKAFTGGGLHLSNGAQVTYDQGLASSEFASGPGGSWVITEWQIIY